ncbi:MAG TPA: ectonucleotide pyrophosphatase/phosphodiesterase [Candidatus Acidoferrales bacterium]|nr:ectonucleotide pyrophosphatase/phosphodiesterase [Candidatus Acidoferrales bacterium]
MEKIPARAFAASLRALCVVLFLAASLPAQQRVMQSSSRERPPSPQTAPSRRFTQRSAVGRAEIRHIILISVDGMMPETYLNPDARGLKVPTLREIVRQGAYSEGARSVFPTVTYPSHTSMITGCNPGTHGIVTNHPFDPLGQLPRAWRWYAEDIHVPTLLDAARTKGMTTAIVFWPVSVGARATAYVPEFWRQEPGTPEDAKLNFAISTPSLLDAVAKRFPDFRANFVPPAAKDEALTDIAVHVIETLQPNLMLMHIFEVDHWQHREGPFTGRALLALENADQQVARVITAAKKSDTWNQTVLVVVSDHGFALTPHRVHPEAWLREKGLVTLDAKGKKTDWKAYLLADGGAAYIYLRDKQDQETRRIVLEMFQKAAATPGTGIGRVLNNDQIVGLGGDPEAFLALEAAEDWTIVGGIADDATAGPIDRAGHGYSPERPAMQASLLVYGPSIGRGKIRGARLIDVGPTVARMLGLKLDRAEGKPLEIPMRRAPRSSANRQ